MDDQKVDGQDKPTASLRKHPWERANIISRLLFWWLVPIIKLGNERTLREKDLYQIASEDESETLGLALGREWLKQVEEYEISKKKKPSLTKTLFNTFGSQLLFPAFLLFVEECIVKIWQPLCLNQLISYFDLHNKVITKELAYLYATGVIAGSAFIALTHHFLSFYTQHIGMKARVASCSLIYRKSLCLSQRALSETAIGKMINLVSNDGNRFDQLFFYIHYLWIGPLQIIITTIVLYFYIGLSSLVGLVIMLGLLVPLQSRIAKLFSKFRKEVSLRTDDRIRFINEIIPKIRVIKMNVWESPFVQLIKSYRQLEMKAIRTISYLRAFNQTLSFISSKLLIFPTLLAIVLLGNEVTPNTVFLVVSLFNNIRMSMPGSFNIAIQLVAEAKVSIKRIEEFLLLDEQPKNNTSSENKKKLNAIKESTIEFNQITAKWPIQKSSDNEFNEQNTLTDVSFQVNVGQLLTLMGSTGSGKSTLLNVILGELPIIEGSFITNGKIAYCSQEPWIFNGSIQQMILCGHEMNSVRYDQVIRATALDVDFKQLPQGNSSIIGEGGISLSGGQKARVNLARCLYVDADIYLLDDPLSAVDAHVASHIFQHAIKNFLRDKVCVLVTHQLPPLKDMDLVLLLKTGHVEFSGPFHQLKKSALDLGKMVLDYPNEDASAHCDLAAPMNEEVNGNCSSVSSKIQNESSSKHVEREENTKAAGVDWKIYWKYFKSGNSVAPLIIMAILLVVAELLFCVSDYWLKIWIESEKNIWNNSNNTTLPHQLARINFHDTESTNQPLKSVGEEWALKNRQTGVLISCLLIGSVFVFGYLRAVQFFRVCMAASLSLHDKMFQAVINSPVHFFDRNPVGSIINRFSRDTGNMDDQVAYLLFDTIWIGLNTIGTIVTVTIVQYWLLLPALLVGVLFWPFQTKYLKTSCAIKRLEASTKSPVFTQLHASLSGLTTLRAHRCQAYFQRNFDNYQDVHSSAWFLYLALARSFAVWIDLIILIYIACVTFNCVALRDNLGNIEAGLMISLAMSLGRFQFGMRQAAELENQMTSVDRIVQYGQLPSEHVLEAMPPPQWPFSGKIEFENVNLRYNSSGPYILKNINFIINPCEKIGIVGRSGAGKTSIIAALLRLTDETDGKIIIDGVDVKMIGLHDLRSKISIISQEPTLFRGSLRFNLDPTGKLSDQVLWSAIKDVKLDLCMGPACNGVGNQSLLDFLVSEGGTNLSVGQRQIVCLARVSLLQNRILILDEATASIDLETDTFIQNFIREKFPKCTILTIAHRLNTIVDSDKIMVISDGQLLEFDEPIRLLSIPSGMFYSMVEKMDSKQHQNSH